jgi:peptide/nickel transport system substrate-binding protein
MKAKNIAILVAIIAALVGAGGWYALLQVAPPKERAVIRIAPEAGIGNLDPVNWVTTVDFYIDTQIYDTLVEIDWSTMTLKPGLATSWERVGETEWVFRLREGVIFHDGTTFDATAVKMSIERSTDPKVSKWAETYFKPVFDRVEIIDKFQVKIITKGSTPYLPWILANTNMGIVSPTALQKYGADIGRNPVGTGPFQFVRWVEKEFVELKAFDRHWRGAPKLGGIIWKIIPEEGSRYLALKAGDVDIIANPPTEVVPELEKNPDFRLIASPANRMVGIFINTFKPPLDDKRVRQAIFYAINREEIHSTILRGLAARAETPFGPFTFGKLPNDYWGPKGRYSYDPEKAKTLLREAGWIDTDGDGFLDKDGRKLSLLLRTPSGRYLKDKEIAEAVSGYLRGIDIKLEVLEPATHFSKITAGDQEIYILGWGWGPYPTPSERAMFYAGDKPSATWARWKNAEADRIMDLARVEPSEQKRKELFNELEKLIMDEAIVLPIYYKLNLFVSNKFVKGFEVLPNEEPVKMLNTTIERPAKTLINLEHGALKALKLKDE